MQLLQLFKLLPIIYLDWIIKIVSNKNLKMKKINFLPLILIVAYHLLISKNYDVPFWIEILIFVVILILCGSLAYKNYLSEQKQNLQGMLIIGTILVALGSFLYFFNF
jgi:uncharacterized membrane protein AbrB (regulator of aidB expression)